MDVEIERFPKQWLPSVQSAIATPHQFQQPPFPSSSSMADQGENEGQIMNTLLTMDNKIKLLQTNIESFETNLTNLTNSITNLVINKVAADANADDHHQHQQHAAFNPQPSLFRLPKINFPRFDGEDPRAWAFKCDQFFQLCPVPETQKVLFASFHLDGRPDIWFRSYYDMKGRAPEWRAFVDDIVERFGRSRLEVLGEFRRLQQTTTVLDYLEKFEEVVADAIWEYQFDEKFIVSNFIAGLSDEIKFRVQMLNPTTVSEASQMARLQEAALMPIVE